MVPASGAAVVSAASPEPAEHGRCDRVSISGGDPAGFDLGPKSSIEAISCVLIADRMLDMGFLRDVERIIGELPEKKQTMLFSATMPADIEKLTNRLLKDPVRVAVTPVASTVESVEQFLYYVNKSNKTKLLIHLLKDAGIYSALVFTRTKHGANKLAEALREAGETVMSSMPINTEPGSKRCRFKSGKSRVLVATDIVARGIILQSFPTLSISIYPSRGITSTGSGERASRLGGTAISFSADLRKYVSDIEWLTGESWTLFRAPYPCRVSQTAGTAYGRAYGAGRQPYSGRGYSSRKSPNARYKRS